MTFRAFICLAAMASCNLSMAQNSNFSFHKKGPLIQRPDGMPKPGPYYTCLVDMKAVPEFPFEYALYFSTDHNRDAGIWLYVCNGSPSDAKNWQSYDEALANGSFDYLKEKPAANPIFLDTTQGDESETPHLNVIDQKLYMTYHNKIKDDKRHRGQKTLLATSGDGVNFTRINPDGDSVILEGSTHTGYFRWAPNPFSGVSHKYVGYSLFGGGPNYHSAMWVSDDAMNWTVEQVFKPTEGQAMAEKEMILIPHEIDPASFRPLGNGEYVGLAAGGNRASGGKARVVEIYEVFLAADGKTYTRECRKVLAKGAEGTLDSEEAAEPTTLVIGDTWHMIYVGASKGGKQNTVMSAEGTLDLNASTGQRLSSDEGTRHFEK